MYIYFSYVDQRMFHENNLIGQKDREILELIFHAKLGDHPNIQV